jgi:hypothetical protein
MYYTNYINLNGIYIYVNRELFREADHKFEFTRNEFREWAAKGILASSGRSAYL